MVLHQAHGAAPLWSAWQRDCSQSLPCCCSALYHEQAECVPARRVLAEVLQLLVGSSSHTLLAGLDRELLGSQCPTGQRNPPAAGSAPAPAGLGLGQAGPSNHACHTV